MIFEIQKGEERSSAMIGACGLLYLFRNVLLNTFQCISITLNISYD